MMAFTARAAFTSSDSNQSFNRSVMLDVNSRVTSAAFRTPRPLYRHASRAVSRMSDAFGEPTFGGVCMSSGPRMSARPSIHASHLGIVSASRFENFAISSWFRFASS